MIATNQARPAFDDVAAVGAPTPAYLPPELVAQLAQLRQESQWQRGGLATRVLSKESRRRVMLLALKAGARLERHQAPGTVGIRVLEGRVVLRLPGGELCLQSGYRQTIAPNCPHEVEALTGAALLVTLTLAPMADARPGRAAAEVIQGQPAVNEFS